MDRCDGAQTTVQNGSRHKSKGEVPHKKCDFVPKKKGRNAMKHGKLGSKFYCDEINKETTGKLISEGGRRRRSAGFGCVSQKATRAMPGHLWVSVWDTSGESGVAGGPLASARSSWMETETERPSFWQSRSSLSQLHHRRTQQKQRHDDNSNDNKHSQQVDSRRSC